jgi:hypothetical protein
MILNIEIANLSLRHEVTAKTKELNNNQLYAYARILKPF